MLAQDEADRRYLLQVFVLNKALYELGYELNCRPDWLIIPFKGILQGLREIQGQGM